MRSILVHLVLLATTLTLGACGEQAEETGTEAFVSTIHDAPTNVDVALTLDRTELDPAGLLRATLTITYPRGVSVQPIEPLHDDSELTLSDRTESTITFDGDRFSRTIDLTYEPYLPGTFELASFGARIDQPDQPRRVVRLAPIEINVASVLDESDDGSLEAAAGTYLPPEPDHANIERALIIAAIVMGVGCIGIILIIRRLGSPSAKIAPKDPETRIREVLRSGSLDEPEIVAIHNALAELARRRAGVAPLLADVERARFGSVPNRDDVIRRAASRAVDFREPTGGQS
jgi:hypothetical protein